YASESNPYAYTPPRDGTLLTGTVFGISFADSIVTVQADIIDVVIGWSISRQMPVDVAISVNGSARQAVRTTETQLTIQAKTNDRITVTVTPRPATGGAGRPM